MESSRSRRRAAKEPKDKQEPAKQQKRTAPESSNASQAPKAKRSRVAKAEEGLGLTEQQPAPAAAAPPSSRKGRRSQRASAAPNIEPAPVAAAGRTEPKDPQPAQPSRPPTMSGQRPDDDDDMGPTNAALQGLLRKLGAGFDDIMAMSGGLGGSRYKAILNNLRQVDDESAQLGALTELCEIMAISSEDMLQSFPIETAVPLLVQCLNSEHNPDMMLLAARALTFMADTLPNSCGAIVRHGAVASFCQRLLTIEYIDLAEQSLTALEKLSHEHSPALLQQGGLLAVLSYLDFFPTGVQRVAVSTAATMCRTLNQDNIGAVREAVPMLTNLLQNSDAKVVEHACMALSHIASAYAKNTELLSLLSSGGLVGQALQLVSLNESGGPVSQLSLNTYYSLIKLLATCAASSPAVAVQLLEGGVLRVVCTLLATSSLLPGAGPGTGSSMLRSADQLYEVVALVTELLPALPEAPTVVTENLPALPGGSPPPALPGAKDKDASPSEGPAAADKAGAAGKEKEKEGGKGAAGAKEDERAVYLYKNADAVQTLAHEVLPLLLQLYTATVIAQARNKCLGAMARVLAVSPPEVLSEALTDVAISSFVASLVNARESGTACYGLHMAEILMLKLPDVFRMYFLKEGVVHAMEQAAAKAGALSGPTSPAPASAAGANAAAAGGSGGAAAEQPSKVTRASSRLREALMKEAAAAAGGATNAAAATQGTTEGGDQPSLGRRSSRSPPKNQQQTAATTGPTAGAENAAGATKGPAAAEGTTGAGDAQPQAGGASGRLFSPTAGAAARAGAPTSHHHSRSSSQPSTGAVRDALAQRAARLCARYFSDSSGANKQVFETEGLAALRKTAARLSSDPEAVIKLLQLLAGPASASPSSGAGSTEKGAPGAVTKSSSLLRRSFNSGLPSSGSGAISVFELVNSGAVKVLSDYLQGNDIPAGPGHEQALLQRLRAFVNAALSPDSGANPPMLALVRKLAGALASMETFPVICSRLAPGPSASGGSSMSRYGYDAGSFSRGGSASYSASMGAAGGSNPLSSGLAALTHPFKLRLCRHTNERNLRDYGSNVVLIEPLASMSAIEDFLWPRVNRGPSSGGTSAGAGGGTAGTAGTGTTAAAAGTTAGAPGTTTAAGAAGARGTAAAPGSGIGNTAAGTTSAGQPSATTATRSGVMSGLRAALASATERAAALASAAAAASKAQPIPEEAGGTNRRVTRSAAAAAAAAAANDKAKGNDARSGGAAKGQVSSAVDAPAGPPGAAAGEDDEDAAMHEDDYDHDHDHDPHDEHMYDDEEADEDDYDEEMAGEEDEDHDMDLGMMHVHDLHMEESGAAAAASTGTAAATATAGTTTAAAAPPGSIAAAVAAAARAASRSAAAAAAAAAADGDAAPSSRAGAGAAGAAGGAAAPSAGAPSAAATAATATEAGAGGPRPSAWGRGGAGGSGAGAGGSGSAADAVRSEMPRLVFYVGSQKLTPSATVFQAIQQYVLSGGEGGAGALDAGDLDGEEGEGGPGSRGTKLWDRIHTLYYRASEPSDAIPPPSPATSSGAVPFGNAAGGAAAGGEGGADSVTTQVFHRASAAGIPLGAYLPLQEIQSVSIPADISAAEACKDALLLLQLLEVINRTGSRMVAACEVEGNTAPGGTAPGSRATSPAPAEGTAGAGTGRRRSREASEKARGGSSTCAPPSNNQQTDGAALAAPADRPVLGRVLREDLTCSKLGSKLSTQLKDVLSICGGGMPAWCRLLVNHAKHLFPFEVRRRYFNCTAFGLGRALQHMQALNAAEVGGTSAADREARELRIGRLQRQKVRVSRKRILESATKVMELYARHRAVLELEFFNEVGTGLGPTLEFYTLLSHDLQRRSLHMWRHEDAATTTGTGGNGEGSAMDVDKPASTSAGGALTSAASGERPAAAVHMHVEPWHDDSEYVNAPWGLFPAPLPPSQRSKGSKVVELFRLLGRTVGKALQDSRLLDLPLNYTFYRAVMGKPLDLYDVARFDPQLGAQLEKMWAALQAASPPQAAADAKAAGGSKSGKGGKGGRPRSGSAGGKGRRRASGSSDGSLEDAGAGGGVRGRSRSVTPAGPVLIDGVSVDDLCLTFTLPGDPSFELVPGGSDRLVTSESLGEWVELVVDATVGSGIAAQVAAFQEGFNEVFPLSSLSCFYEDEIETILCGAGEHWTVQSLMEAIKFDHGYTSSSPVIKALLEVLAELDPTDQRRFLRFVTGCPRLPPGGLSSLQPRLTVVRKQPSGGEPRSTGATPHGSLKEAPGVGTPLADGDLPSVMTCANYIKLPPYSAKHILKERLLFAVREGQGSFDLS